MSQYPNQPPLPPQYPPPYEPPGFGDERNWPLPTDLHSPSRRASLLLWILGGLTVALALMVLAAWHFVPDDAIQQQLASMPKSAVNTPTVPELRRAMGVVGIMLAIVGGILLALGIAVRGGGKISAIIAIGTCGVAVLGLLRAAASLFFAGGNPTGAICALCLLGPAFVLFLLAIRSLLQSISANQRLTAYYQHAAMQQMYRQYQQQQHQQQPGPPPAPDSIPDYNLPPPPPPPPPEKRQ